LLVTEPAPISYKVTYSERVQATLREFSARAAQSGRCATFLAAVKELDRLLHLYPQFGEPLLDLKLDAGQVYTATVPPLVVRYAVFEERRLVFVGSPPQLLPNAGF
jgi:hypothetical protein